MRALFTVFPLLLVASQALAQIASCPHRDDILTHAQIVLDTRPDIPGFSGARVGLDAGYLMLRYAPPGTVSLEQVYEALGTGRRPHAQRDDLALTYRIWKEGAVAALSAGGRSPEEGFDRLWPAVWRAIILEDGGKTFVDLFDAFKAQEAAEGKPGFPIEMRVTVAIFDEPDSVKKALADYALAKGHGLLALVALAEMADRTDFDAMVATLSDPVLLRIAEQKGRSIGLYPAIQGLTPDAGISGMLLPVAKHVSPGDFLLIFSNQTGDFEAAAVATAVLARAVEDGRIDPVTDMDQAWRLLFDALVVTSGEEQVVRTLQSFDVSRRWRHYATRAYGTIAAMEAAFRLGPFAVGAGSEVPAPHRVLAYPDGWVETAQALRAGGAIAPERQAIAAELLWAGGDEAAALALARQAEPATRQVVLDDFIKRLDRRCAAVTYFFGQSLVLGGDFLWEFPPAE